MKNLLITGFTGFVGTALINTLDTQQYKINLLGRKNDLNNYSFYQGDFTQTSNYEDALSSIDVVIHCAARVHVMNDNCENPLDEFRAVNTQGTLNLAMQAAQAGVKRFIFISTIKVNGETTSGRKPFSAFDHRTPEDPYGISKAEAEEQLLKLSQKTGMEIVIIRPPLVYGEDVKANFASLMRFVGKGFPLPFRAIKQNKRSLVSVYNLVDLINVCISHSNAANQTFLVSDDHDLSTAEMVALMAKVQGKKNLALPVPLWFFKLIGKVFSKQAVIDRLIGSLQLDISHTKNTLGWFPPHTVEHGFKLSAKSLIKN